MSRLKLAIVLILAAGGAHAHHSAAPHFDMETAISLDGVITELKFVNPHAYFYFDVTDESGATVNWRCEMSAATALKRLGWTPETLKPGESVTVNGAPARREEHVCYLNFLTLSDGTRMAREGVVPSTAAADRPVAVREADTPIARYLANGQPNISGQWVAARGPGGPPGRRPGGAPGPGGAGRPRGNPGPPPGLPAPTDAGIAAAAGYEQPFDDPGIFCHPANIIFAWTHDQHVNKIDQQDDRITLTYGYMDLVRTIHLDQAEHPSDIVPSVAGHSIGRWDGDVLVVDTVGFEPGVLVPISGLKHSDQMHVTERFELSDDGQTLVRHYTVHDPAFLQGDWVRDDEMRRTNEAHVPYNCTELSGDNNRRRSN
jgi:Family of unknown function (DUF6152)